MMTIEEVKRLEKISQDKYNEYLEAEHEYSDSKKSDSEISAIYDAYEYKYVCYKKQAYMHIEKILVCHNAAINIYGPMVEYDSIKAQYSVDNYINIDMQDFDKDTGLCADLQIVAKKDFIDSFDIIIGKLKNLKDKEK